MAETTYTIEKILNHKYKGKRRLYYIKWQGYPEEENTWIKKSDFVDNEIRQQYEHQQDSS